MEDRINSGLLLVLIERAADAALGDWDKRLRGLPGVAGISWWKNVQLNRSDWLGQLHFPTRMPRPCFSGRGPVWRSASAAAPAIPASTAGNCIPRFASTMSIPLPVSTLPEDEE